MKYFVVICTVLLATTVQDFTDKQKTKHDEYSKVCLKKSKVEKSVLKEAKKGVYFNDPKLKY
ncbi:uncharacterized protein LOC123011963 [Tribolium madens]|uniref:uncharacterized protein LOC123011963 n=1 Tax=Tribolium madens TaxID=41895 RepID=UPI001CF7638C|nr:uncharacterized protein LOC123011963 [Tribolium madens]